MASYTILEDAYTATLKREFPHTHDILRLDLAFLMACGGGEDDTQNGEKVFPWLKIMSTEGPTYGCRGVRVLVHTYITTSLVRALVILCFSRPCHCGTLGLDLYFIDLFTCHLSQNYLCTMHVT